MSNTNKAKGLLPINSSDKIAAHMKELRKRRQSGLQLRIYNDKLREAERLKKLEEGVENPWKGYCR